MAAVMVVLPWPEAGADRRMAWQLTSLLAHILCCGHVVVFDR